MPKKTNQYITNERHSRSPINHNRNHSLKTCSLHLQFSFIESTHSEYKKNTSEKDYWKYWNPSIHRFSIFHSAKCNEPYEVFYFFPSLFVNKLSTLFLTMVPFRCEQHREKWKHLSIHSKLCAWQFDSKYKAVDGTGKKVEWTATRLKAVGEHEHWTWTTFYFSSSATSLGVCFFCHSSFFFVRLSILSIEKLNTCECEL